MTDSLRLSELLELECRIAGDAAEEPDSLARRDRAVGARLDRELVDNGPRPALLRGWLDALAAKQPATAARQVRGALRWTTVLLSLVGFLVGAGAAELLLRYDGTTPVNVGELFVAIVGVQATMLAGLLIALVWRPLSSAPNAAPGVSAGSRLAAWTWRRLATIGVAPERRQDLENLVHRLRGRRSLYRNLEAPVLLRTTQLAAVAFNVAALLALLRQVTFTDIAFGWGTTLQVAPEDLHRWIQGLSVPWAWVWPAAVPSLDLVDATRYIRLEGAYANTGEGAARARDVVLVGGWWRFLVAATLTYGLLPRTTLALAGMLWTRQALRLLPLDTPDIDAIVDRLRAPDPTRWDPGETPTDSADPPLPIAATPPGAEAPKTMHVVQWRDAAYAPETLARWLETRHGAGTGSHYIAGTRDYADERSTIDALTRSEDDAGVVLVAEHHEAPDRGAHRVLRAVRAAIGPRRAILVALVGGDGPRRARARDIWSRGLQPLEDPYLAVTTPEDEP